MPETTQPVETGINPETDYTSVPEDTSVPNQKRFKLPHLSRLQWAGVITGSLFVLLFTIAGVLGFHTYSVISQIRAQGTTAEATARTAYDSFKAQNLPEVQNQLASLDEQLGSIEMTYRKLGYYRYVPLAARYYDDGSHGIAAAKAGLTAAKKSVDAIVPYADVLGFAGEGSFEGGTAEDRLKLVLETLDKISPILDDISADLEVMQAELDEINPEHYPETLQGREVRSRIVQLQQVSQGAATALTDYRPVLEQLPAIAGGRGERKKYLVLFQNDNELRPTGGFLTAYAVITVEDGKVSPEKSDDIYELDKKFNKRLEIPEKLDKYLTTERYFNLRDMNIDPDFKNTMDLFFSHYQEVPGEPDNIDGIIAVDTHVLTRLLEILGPVEVPGYGTFTAETDARCDCPQIIYALSEIITKPTPYIREDRKGILGPLMRSVLTKSYGAPKTVWPDLFASMFESIQGRHVQMYFLNEDAQQAAEAINAAGRLQPVENSDSLAIVNANLGGAKSNLFIQYEASQEVSEPQDGFITKTLEITYKNTRRADNCNLEAGQLCLNSTLNDWTRIYVPEGSELISANGFVEEPVVYEENGFTVFDGDFTLEPLGLAKLLIEYKVPYSDAESYQLRVWKQGGIESFPFLVDVTGGQEQLTISKDTVYSTPF